MGVAVAKIYPTIKSYESHAKEQGNLADANAFMKSLSWEATDVVAYETDRICFRNASDKEAHVIISAPKKEFSEVDFTITAGGVKYIDVLPRANGSCAEKYKYEVSLQGATSSLDAPSETGTTTDAKPEIIIVRGTPSTNSLFLRIVIFLIGLLIGFLPDWRGERKERPGRPGLWR